MTVIRIVILHSSIERNLNNAKAVTSSRFGRGTGVIWLSQVTCSGSENDLNECHSPVWGDHTCTHDQDAGVVCQHRPSTNKNGTFIIIVNIHNY